VADIFTEVDEDVRRDRAFQLWKRYGNYVVGAAVVVVIATAGFVAWRDYDRKQIYAEAARFAAASELQAKGNTAQALAAFGAIVRDGRPGYAQLARLRQAAIMAQSGDVAGALAIYRALTADSGVEREIRDIAQVLATLNDLDNLDPAGIDRQLAALAGANSPWRYTALELSALAAARGGDAAKARELYAKIADDPAAPASLRARAAEMLAALAG
jgi:hypothetical protein